MPGKKSKIEDDREKLEIILQLAANGTPSRKIAEQMGIGKSTISRILIKPEHKARIQEIKERGNAIVRQAYRSLDEDQQVFEKIENRDIDIIPLSPEAYVTVAIDIQQTFIDRAMRNMAIADELEKLAHRLTAKAHEILNLEEQGSIELDKSLSLCDRVTRILKPVVSSKKMLSEDSLALLEVGLQTGEIGKFMDNQK